MLAAGFPLSFPFFLYLFEAREKDFPKGFVKMGKSSSGKDEEVIKIVEFLRSGASGLTEKSGALSGNRVTFFKGKHLVNALLRDSYKKKKNAITFKNRQSVVEFLTSVLRKDQYFARVVRYEKNKLELPDVPKRQFSEDEYYVWIYEGSKFWNILQGFGLLFIVFLGVTIPLWPGWIRKFFYYISAFFFVLILILLLVLVVRLFLNIAIKILTGKDLWVFPRLLEDVSIKENVTPLYQIFETEPLEESTETLSEQERAQSSEHLKEE